MKHASMLVVLFLALAVCLTAVDSVYAYDFSYSYKDPSAPEADDYIVSVSNAVLHDEGHVRYWKQDVGSSTLESGTPGVITYRFDFQQAVAEAEIMIRTSTFHWSYSKGHSFIYGSIDGTAWVQLAEASPPDYGGGNTQVARTLPESLLGGQSLWFKVELYSFGDEAPGGGIYTNTAQHSRYDDRADNTTFQLNVNLSSQSSPAVESPDFFYSYRDPSSPEADDYIVDVSNAVLWNEGSVRYWKQDVGSSTLETGTPGVITYRFDFQQPVAAAELLIATSTFHWSYSKGNAYIYGSTDGTTWVRLSEGLPPAFGEGAAQAVRTLPAGLLGSTSLWFKVELYSYGAQASGGGVSTNTSQHSRYDQNADNTTFQLNVGFSGGNVESTRQQCATYDASTNTIGLSCVTVGGAAYSAELSLYSTDPLQFQLTWIDTYTGGLLGGDCAEFDLQELTLYVPCLRLSEEGFAAGLVLTSSDPILFGVKDVVGTGSLSGVVMINFDVNEDAGDPLIATFTDVGGKHYALYGPKDSDGVPLSYERLETFTVDANGNLHDYLTIEYDSSLRPILFRLPGGRGEVAVQYVSTGTARVTITGAGATETVDVANPYPEIKAAPALHGGAKAGPLIEAESEISFSGAIKSCAPEATPTVTIRRNFDSALRAKYPLLSQPFSPTLSSETSEDDEDFFYWYKFTIPGEDYDAWYWKCARGYWLDPVVGFFGDNASRLANFFRDVTGVTASNTAKGLTEEAATAATGGLYPAVAWAQGAKEAWEAEGSGKNGPCSRTAYDFKRKRLMHEQTVTVVDDGMTRRQTFQPKVRWDGVGFSYDAPSFDFTDQCQACDPIALASIMFEDDCYAAGGYWWSTVIGGGGWCECP